MVLGSAMLEPQEALPRIAPRLRTEHFYFTSHREIYKAILHLYEKADAPDTLSVANYLEEQGKLDQLGGRAYLTELLSRVTTVAALDHYVNIVEVKALRRGLIDGGARISELGYREDMDLEQALDRAEELIYKLSKRGTAQEYWSLRDFLQEHVAQLEELHNDPERRPARSLSTGFSEFDALTSGLHPSNLIVLAGRPGTGKTSLALDMARHVALRQKKSVGFFSMEMPKEQILERILCAQARVDLHKLRSGYLPAAKWGQIAEAAGQINEAVVLVDDAPAAPVLAIRSKARRMNSEHALGLIIVDYLQLIDAGVRTDIREQEISYISRSLKGLARELDVPVIACSQLNRAVERRETKRPQLSDLRECVTGDTKVILADGRRIPIRELKGESPEVLSLDSDGQLCTARAELVWRVGLRPVYQIQLASGRVIRATADHRLRAYDGWRAVSALSPGDRLAVARRLPEPPRAKQWPDDYANVRFAPSRRLALKCAELMQDEILRRPAESDVFWDRIAAMNRQEDEEVFDLTVPGPECWLADGIVSHNSGAIEQDADMVVFIYRPDYYEEPSQNVQVADTEIIVAKHRNGPLGKFILRFHKSYASFSSPTRQPEEVPF